MSRDFGQFAVPDLVAVVDKVGADPMAYIYLPKVAGQVIVCSTESPTNGLYVEQEAKSLAALDANPEHLSRAVWEALLRFRKTKSHDLRDTKKTDWVAYKASGMRSVRAFEDAFVRVSVRAFPCVLRVECEVPVKAANGLFVGRYISNACEFSDLGDLIYLVHRCGQLIGDKLYG